jgi:hypothetical protein
MKLEAKAGFTAAKALESRCLGERGKRSTVTTDLQCSQLSKEAYILTQCPPLLFALIPY